MLARKLMDLFQILINQRLQDKRPSVDSIPNNDVLDALLGISHDEKEKIIEPSNIPHLLLVVKINYKFPF